MRAAETLLWVFGVVVVVLTVAAVLANGRAPKRPVPPELGDDILPDGTTGTFTDADLDRTVAKWEKDNRRG